MRIRTNILGWIVFATIVPLTAVALTAIYFLERDYRLRVATEINNSLNTITADLKRHFEAQRNLAAGLADSNVVQEFVVALHRTDLERIDSRYNVQWGRVNHYFEGFQTIVQGGYRMRLLDTRGNTLVKVTESRRSPPLYAGFTNMYYVENELNDPRFARMLAKLPPGEVSSVILPHNQQSEQPAILPEYDYLVPLRIKQRLVGALALTLFGEDLDRVMDHAIRAYRAQLFIVEDNPDVAARHGMVLYDDMQSIQISQARPKPHKATELYGDEMFSRLLNEPYGFFTDSQSEHRVFYMELFPYERQLTRWVIGARVPIAEIEQPFEQARRFVLYVGGLAVLVNLLLASFGVARFTAPLRLLSQHLLAFARGEHSQRANTGCRMDEIRDLEKAFNTMADSLDHAAAERDKAQHMMLQNAKLASIGQLAAGVGHELNNPLNNILSYAKLIERSLPDASPEIHADIAALKDEAQRAGQIVQGILNFARQVPPHFAPFQVLLWLQDTLALVKQSAKTAGITLAYECPEDFIMVGDRGQLQQALINLLLNAIQASSANDQVLVRARQADAEVRISVTDQGKGIRSENLDKVFDPFFTTKAEGEGSGLGLSISHGIIERHGGELIIANNLDRGVTALIRLPKDFPHESAS